MNETIKKDILDVLASISKILKNGGSVSEVKELSNHVIHNASIFQDEDSISIAVLAYSISKIMERKQNLDALKLVKLIESSMAALKGPNHDSFEKSINEIFSFIRIIDEDLSLYIQEVIRQAQVKKGCNLCQHGISIARASEIMGISQWELMHYMGKTTMIDKIKFPSNVSGRLKFARGLFQ